MKTTTTNELPDEIMENGIHYTLVGDYYFLPVCWRIGRTMASGHPCMSAICRRSIRTSRLG